MAGTGETVTYAELEPPRSNRLTHLLRGRGLQRLDHYSIFMENNARYVECCAAGERSGLYYTCINSYLTPDEVAYLVNNSESKLLILSEEKRAVAEEALKECPNVEVVIVDGPGDGAGVLNLDEATNGLPDTPIETYRYGEATAKRCHSPGTPLSS
jgi:long-chain acyl-CoA synthetase